MREHDEILHKLVELRDEHNSSILDADGASLSNDGYDLESKIKALEWVLYELDEL